MISNLADRSLLLSDRGFHNSNLQLINDTPVENDYPLCFVQEIINQRLLSLEQKTRLGNNHVNINTENKPFVSLPYVEGLSEKVSGILRRYNINTAFKNQKNLNIIFKQTKDKLRIEQASNIVYSVRCKGNNCKAVYIGQTKRFLKNRLNEHKNNVRETLNKQNALTKHTIEKDHFFDFVNTQILANERIYKIRLLLEMYHIAGTDDAVNLRTDVENL